MRLPAAMRGEPVCTGGGPVTTAAPAACAMGMSDDRAAAARCDGSGDDVPRGDGAEEKSAGLSRSWLANSGPEKMLRDVAAVELGLVWALRSHAAESLNCMVFRHRAGQQRGGDCRRLVVRVTAHSSALPWR